MAGLPTAGTFRAGRVVVDVFGCIRASYVVTALSVILVKGDSAYAGVTTQAWLLAGATAWSAYLFWSAHQSEKFDRKLVWIDVLIATALLAFGTRQCILSERLTWGNWSFTYGLSTALVAGAAGGRLLLPEIALMVVAFLYGLWPGWHSLPITNLIGNTSEFAWFAAIAFLAARFLRGIERKLNAAFVAQVAAESRRAALTARYNDRLAHYGVLHDTVLSTLTAISRGGLDYRAPQVRELCARQAGYLRRLIHSGLSDGDLDAGLEAALLELVAEAEDLGLRVRYHTDAVPDVPAITVSAIIGAAREALNNVRLHSGSSRAWVTVVGDAGVVTVTVADQGAGFEPGRNDQSFGISQSISQRMLDAGGAAVITSLPGHGTSVELRWPR